MENSLVKKEKNSGFKTFLSVIFFILMFCCSVLLSLNLSMHNKDKAILDAYGTVIGGGLTDFLSGNLCFWCSAAAVVLWFVLWICTTKRIASAIRGLGLSCAISAAVVLICELVSMLLVCAFKMDSVLSPIADSLPSQFADTAGRNVILLLSSTMIASVGIFICKLQRLPKKEKSEHNAATSAETAPVSETIPVPETVPAGAAASDTTAEEKSAAQSNDSLVNSLLGVCHMCGHRNEPNVKFCGKCGAKLI